MCHLILYPIPNNDRRASKKCVTLKQLEQKYNWHTAKKYKSTKKELDFIGKVEEIAVQARVKM